MEIVYIVDDNVEFTDNVKELLTLRGGFDEVRVFNDPVEFLNHMNVDVMVAVVDFFMPKMNGDQVILEIKKIQPECMVILVSVNEEAQLPVKILRQNYMEYVCKTDHNYISKIATYAKKHFSFIRFRKRKTEV